MLYYIEIMVETHHGEDNYYKYHQKHTFFTRIFYSHDEISKIMASIEQKYIQDENGNSYCMEIDLEDLKTQLSKYEIYMLLPVERYYFDLEEEN